MWYLWKELEEQNKIKWKASLTRWVEQGSSMETEVCTRIQTGAKIVWMTPADPK